jgi:predicted nucleotidyltransferase
MGDSPATRQVIALLSAHTAELVREYGLHSLALFGSVARDEAGPDSDVDLLVEFCRPIGLFDLIRLQHRLEEILGRPVDLGTRRSLRPRIRDSVLGELLDVA